MTGLMVAILYALAGHATYQAIAPGVRSTDRPLIAVACLLGWPAVILLRSLRR